MQALFNYFSCSAVAIATQVGGANAALVTFLMIAAHMVRPLYCLAVITAIYLTICCILLLDSFCVTSLQHTSLLHLCCETALLAVHAFSQAGNMH